MKQKQNILLVHNTYQIPGGEDTVVRNEKHLMEQNGHKVVLYTRSNTELKGFSMGQRFLLPFTTIFNLRTYREIRKIIKEEQIDVVHVHNTLNLISPSVYYAALSRHVPVVQTIHNFRLLCPAATFYRDEHICEECVDKGLRCAVKHSCYRESKLQTLACVICLTIHRTLGIYGKISYICLTEFNRGKLLQLKQINPVQVYVKPNFADGTAQITEKRDQAVLFAARLERIKGIELVLEAWKEMGEEAPKLYLCGTGTKENWCKEYIEKHRLSSVEFLGQTDHHRLLQIMGCVKALILPTQWYEGFPMTIVEAYSVGTPVIGPDMGNVGDLIEEGVTGWTYSANSIEALVQTICNSMKASIDYKKIAELYQQRYNPELNYQLLTDIYRKAQELV